MNQHAIGIVNDIFAMYEQFGRADYIGEPVSQIEHMSQAADLAKQKGYDDEVVLAAFFHDIGHLCEMGETRRSMGGYGTVSHEKTGAAFLRSKGFPEKIAKLVENHVQAKRYLTFRHPDYYRSLSEASKQTLIYQGGVMTEKEAEDFELDPLFELSIEMRTWDELAKETNVPLTDLRELKQMAIGLLQKMPL